MQGADNETARKRRIVHEWQVGRIDMMEGGVDFLHGIRQGKPCLHTGNRHGASAFFFRRAFGMDNAPARRHEVHIARTDDHLRSQAVAMADMPIEKIGNGG